MMPLLIYQVMNLVSRSMHHFCLQLGISDFGFEFFDETSQPFVDSYGARQKYRFGNEPSTYPLKPQDTPVL